MKTIAIVSFSDMRTDSRIKRYINYLIKDNNILLIANNVFEFRNKNNITAIDLSYYGGRKNKSIIDFITYQLILKWRLYKLLKLHKPDFVHANDFETLLPSYLAFINKKNKIIYDSHELWSERVGSKRNVFHIIINKIELVAEKCISRRISKIITVSDSIADYMSNAFKIERPVVIRNIPIKEAFGDVYTKYNRLFNDLKDSVKLVYIGPISKDRNTDLFIEAFRRVNDPKLKLILIGKNLLKETISDKNIFLLDEIPESSINGILKQCDIGVHPLRTSDCLNHEYALPNKIFQYMQAGLALFVFKNAETVKIINKYKNGIYCDMSDPTIIESALIQLLKQNISEMKANSISSFSNYYNFDKEMIPYYRFIDNNKYNQQQ